MENLVFLSIGSNIGDSKKHCTCAIELLAKKNCVKILKTSSFYKTEPVGFIEQDWFVNCAVKVLTKLSLQDFFKETKTIEKSFNERSNAKWGPREMDIDILFFNSIIEDTKDLTIPHPRLHERGFVLFPMAELEPEFVHPKLNKTIFALLDSLADESKIKIIDDAKTL